MDNEVIELMFSSKSNEWTTPQDFFDKLNYRFGPFTLDAAATDENYKVSNYYTQADDGLLKDWSSNAVFLNPPYGKEIGKWVEKAYLEGQKPNTTVVMLIPSRTDTAYWQDYVMKADEIYFVRGRLRFGDSKNSAPFPSAVVVFRRSSYPFPRVGAMER